MQNCLRITICNLWFPQMQCCSHILLFITSSKEGCFRRCLSVCLLATLCRNFLTDLHESFREGWQCDNQQLIGGDPDTDWFPDLSLLGDTESGILQSRARTSRRHNSSYDLITSPALGGCMHCVIASSWAKVMQIMVGSISISPVWEVTRSSR